ncbi:sigma-70 family RNA polymerase sigma factor [Pantoea sp. ACRSH]|uniref:RNA polymerase sigma factor n=1 Tax=unclassified Pantoea TaxID=2630326 RepID=UPI001EF3E599|nr:MULTISPECIES: sigma-70 family RNA polymerase sigma factor [unclassified Pantoea]MCG7367566.1 sigma-70 family RNA polymerase sigma factor [Pantoea sp. ACRSH]MCG7398076.1 sigma-70 family RNA polymerase sigma factor [Pantoea sp. ACRSC]
MDTTQAEQLNQLMKAVVNGDRLAFERLYRLTSPYLFAVALRTLRNRAWAEDVLHDCFITVWNNASTFNHALSSPLTWMTHILRNRCIDWLRSGAVRRTAPDEALSDEWVSSPAGLQDGTHHSDRAERLHRCLQNLSSEQRQTLSLAYYQGMSHSEIADWVQQPVGSVKSWIRRGLAHLRECVGL